MTRFICAVLLIAAIQSPLIAQNTCRTFATDSMELQVCYFTTGQMSTEIAHRKSNTHWSTLKAYDTRGKVIYDRSYGQRNGSSNVTISYHPNGSLATARYTMQPDGGIQYTDITTYFTPEGKVDHEEDHSLGGNGMPGITPTHPYVQPPVQTPVQTPAPPAHTTPKPNECAPVPAGTDLYLINYTSERLHIRSRYKDIVAGSVYHDIEPSDTTKIGVYQMNNDKDPLHHYDIEVETKARYDYEYRVSHIPGDGSAKQYIMVTCHKISR